MSSNPTRRMFSRPVLPILWLSLFVASCLHAAPPDCPQCQSEKSGHADISVDQNDNVDKACVRLSKNAKHQAKWRSKIGKPLTVVFQLKGDQLPPFLDMDCQGSLCSIRACDTSGVCNSAQINPDAKPGCYQYKTRHKLAQGAGADPEVMIDP